MFLHSNEKIKPLHEFFYCSSPLDKELIHFEAVIRLEQSDIDRRPPICYCKKYRTRKHSFVL